MAIDDSVLVTANVTDNTNHQFARTIVRDSNDNIIIVAAVGGTPTSFISSDGGSTWNSGIIGGGSVDTCIAVAIDSSDRLHAIYHDGSTDDYHYQRYTQATDGSVTKSVTDEVVVNSGIVGFGHCVIAVDSTDVPWVVVNILETVKGTDVDYAELFDRTGGSWNSDGNIHGVGGQNDFTHFSICVDDTDVKHIAFRNWNQSDTRYRTYDAGFSGADAFGVSKNGAMVLDANDIPIVTTGQNVWKRTSGTWSSDQFTSDSVDQSTVTIIAGNVHAIYVDGSTLEVRQNVNTFGSFSTADVETVEDTTNGNWIKPSAYWQNHNYYDQGGIDYAVEDNAAIDLYYDSTVVTAFVTVTTQAATLITSTSVQLNGEVDWSDSQVEVWFEWRETGASTWNATAKQTITTTGTISFSEDLTEADDGLQNDTEYEFRAQADRDSGTETDTGSILTFFTDLLISGVVDVDGSTVSGVVVYITQVDAATPSAAVEVRTTTAADGSFSEEVPGGNEYHVAAQYDDGSTKYAGESKPYIT